jgi:hypothetical protein
MDLLDSVRILAKRWWLTLPLFVVTLGGVLAGAVLTPWTYRSEATVVFLPSQLQAKETGGNPWLSFGTSLTVTAEVVGREMMDDRTVHALRNQGATATYKVGVAADSTGPVLLLEVEGSDGAVAQRTLDAVLRQIKTRLDTMQTQGGVAPAARIRLSTVSASTEARLLAKDKAQTLIMAAALGLGLTVGVPLLTDSLARRRRGQPVPVYRRDDVPPRPTGDLAQAVAGGSNGHRHPAPAEAAGEPAAPAVPAVPAASAKKEKKEEWEPYLPPTPAERRRSSEPLP